MIPALGPLLRGNLAWSLTGTWFGFRLEVGVSGLQGWDVPGAPQI
jgi:hypothetical protein